MKKTIAFAPNIFLLVVILTACWQINAKETVKDTDIVCFAAQKKWICAPKDNQQIAQEKAKKLIKEDTKQINDEAKNSEVVVRSLNIPKLKAVDDSVTTSNNIDNPVTTSDNTNNTSTNVNNEINKPISKSDNLRDNPNKTNPVSDYSSYWSYQLIGVSTEQAAFNFVAQNNIHKSDLLIVKSEFNGFDWFVVLYNLYKDKASGIQDRSNIPENIEKPWLRPLSNLVIKSVVEDF